MKFAISLVLSIFSVYSLKAQDTQAAIDSALAAKITVSGFCLCHTTVADLKNLDKDLAEVTVEEMDLGKRCMSQDSRYINGKGYYSEIYPGMIFQKDQDEDYISKIRLTKDFKGKLPDGTHVEMDNLLLKDIIKRYPELEGKWGSRGCSDFWSFSNDTIAFYVKIDREKQPQFPIDEAYYLNKPVAGIDIMISCYSIYNKSKNNTLFPPNDPLYFVDSIRVNSGFLKNFQPTEIAYVSVYKDSNAIRLAGKDAVNGAIYILTKSFARQHYWEYFRSKSADYRDKVPDLKTEAEVIYIVNDKILEKDYEGTLFTINNDNFIEMTVVGSEFLNKAYAIHGKSLGVVIKTSPKTQQ
jgi:hypothetical protein